MKKILAVILACSMLLALCACGNASPTTPEDSASAPSGAQASTEPEESGTGPVADAKVLTVAMGFPENDNMSLGLKFFCDKVEEYTGGSVTFEYFWGGSLCSVPECFDYVSNGTIDLTAPLLDASMEKIPLYGWWTFNVSPEESIAAANYIQYENEETAAMIEAELTENNVITFGWSSSGWNAFASTKDIANGFADMAKMTFGSGINTTIMSDVGVTSQSVAESDFYESLSRGVVDCTSSGLSAVCSYKLYEVADYIMVSDTSNAICNITLNLDTWNSLTAEEQDAFNKAAEAFHDYTLKLQLDNYEAYIKEIEESGATVYYMSEEDNAAYVKAYLHASYNSYKDFAANLGVADQYEAIANAVSDYCGFSITD